MIPHDYFEKVQKHFNGNKEKTWEWFKSRNPAFGMFSPLDMIKLGRDSKVMKFIDSGLQGYSP